MFTWKSTLLWLIIQKFNINIWSFFMRQLKYNCEKDILISEYNTSFIFLHTGVY